MAMTEEQTEQVPGTAVDPVWVKAIEAVDKGSITWEDLAKVLAKGKPPEKTAEPKLALPAQITEPEKEAMLRLATVFGLVVPKERRALEPDEIARLKEERVVLDTIEKMAANRKADIRTSVLNHFDVVAEREGKVGADTARDKDGHYFVPGAEPIPESRKRMTWEITEGNATVSERLLEAMVKDPERPEIGLKDWTQMTRRIRVFDPTKAILHLRKRPELLRVLSEVTVPGVLKGSFHHDRNA